MVPPNIIWSSKARVSCQDHASVKGFGMKNKPIIGFDPLITTWNVALRHDFER